MGIVVRKAIEEDCPRLLELVRELAVYEKSGHEVTVALEHFKESGFGKNPVWWAYVACDESKKMDEQIVGFALYYIRYSTWKGQRMYLEDIVVTESARGQGVGKLLFDRLIEEAKDKKFSGIVWQVLGWNKPAINFYNKYDNVKFDNEWVNCAIDF